MQIRMHIHMTKHDQQPVPTALAIDGNNNISGSIDQLRMQEKVDIENKSIEETEA